MVIPSVESAVISEPIKTFLTAFRIAILWVGEILVPVFGLTLMVLEFKKYKAMSFLTIADFSSSGEITRFEVSSPEDLDKVTG